MGGRARPRRGRGRGGGGIFSPAEDFVAFIAEHDEGVEEKVGSLRAANPPERAELWAERLRGL